MKSTVYSVFALLFLHSSAFAFSGGPPDGVAGDPPAMSNCTQCHSSFPVNSGNGLLELVFGEPLAYSPGETYEMEVNLSSQDALTRWGFELTVLNSENNMAGELLVTDATNTQLSDNSGASPDYLKQTATGTYAGQNSGNWIFSWTAPPEGTGPVTFYTAGNTANNNGSTSGDYIYTVSLTLDEDTNPVGDDLFVTIPREFAIDAVYPNPFNPATRVRINLPEAANLRVVAYNALGQQVASLLDGYASAGQHTVTFDASRLASGQYYIQAVVPGHSPAVRPVLLLK